MKKEKEMKESSKKESKKETKLEKTKKESTNKKEIKDKPKKIKKTEKTANEQILSDNKISVGISKPVTKSAKVSKKCSLSYKQFKDLVATEFPKINFSFSHKESLNYLAYVGNLAGEGYKHNFAIVFSFSSEKFAIELCGSSAFFSFGTIANIGEVRKICEFCLKEINKDKDFFSNLF